MKCKIKRNKKDIHIYGPALVILIGVIIVSVQFIGTGHWDRLILCVCWLFLIKAFLDPYQITDSNQLIGAGVVMVPLIQRLERKEKGGIRAYFVRMEGGAVRSRSYYPEDESFFIDKLIEINPNIQIH